MSERQPISQSTPVQLGLILVLATSLVGAGAFCGNLATRVSYLESQNATASQVLVQLGVLQAEVSGLRRDLERRPPVVARGEP